MKLGITGSRSITEFDFIPYFTLKDPDFLAFCRENGFARRKIAAVICGGAHGVDTLAADTAEKLQIRSRLILPDRRKFPGKMIRKGLLERNKKIVDECDLLLAVWDGHSRGTFYTVRYAEKLQRPVFVIKS